MKMKMWNAGLAAALAAGMLWAFPLTAGAAPVFPEGVSAGNQSLAGMTAEEAAEAVQQYIDGLAGQKITLSVGEEDVETTAEKLGFHWANPDAVAQAAEEYTGGSLIRQYMVKKQLADSPVELPLDAKVDSGKVKAFVDAQCEGITAEPKDASITRENGAFVITESVTGKVVDIDATEAALNEALAQGLEKPVHIEAAVEEKQPAVTTEDLESIQDVLGTFTTDFSSSGAARSTNLTVGAAKINGHVLMPGEVLSGYECLQPFTTANGYKTAAAYENGQVVDSIGGGVCQIATTLYNAALEAEVEIAQRQNHSMIVTYVKPSRDAAIAGTYKDIKIKNNYGTPIYVEGYTEGRKLTFTIYGRETRPENRKVEYISETLGSTSPGEPQLIVDNTLAPGAQVKVQSSHTGLRSRLWKVVTVDGVEQERTILNQDTYNASKAIYRVGPALPAVVPPEEQTAAEVPTEVQQPIEGPAGGPGAVAAPAPAADSAQDNAAQPEAGGAQNSPAGQEAAPAEAAEAPAPAQTEAAEQPPEVPAGGSFDAAPTTLEVAE